MKTRTIYIERQKERERGNICSHTNNSRLLLTSIYVHMVYSEIIFTADWFDSFSPENIECLSMKDSSYTEYIHAYAYICICIGRLSQGL